MKEQTSMYVLPLKEIAKKELDFLFGSHLGWIILFLATILNSLFSWFAIQKLTASADILQFIFYFFSGTSMICGVLLGMRIFADEKSLGTLDLLITSPITNYQLVLGKFIATSFFVIIILLASLPIPIIIYIEGNINMGHIFAGYVGNFLLTISVIAITLFYSTLTKTQLFAAAMASTNIVMLLLLGFFSPYVSQPLKSIVRELSLYVHYRDFEAGVLVFHHALFFISVIILYLYLSVLSLKTQGLKE